MLDHIRYAANIEGNTGGATGDHFDKIKSREVVLHLSRCASLFQRQQLKSHWMPKVSPSHSELSFSPLRQGLQHLAISRVLFPKSASEADLPPQSLELDRILRLAA